MKVKHTLSALLLVLALVGLVISAGCVDTTTNQTTTATPTAIPIETPSISETPQTSFSGSGNASIATKLPAGIYILTITQADVNMTEVTVETNETAISVQGIYSAAAADSAKTADGWVWSYALLTDSLPTLIINATGNWTADFSLPQQIDGVPPQTFTGIGNAATPFFMINKGNISFAIKAANNTAVEVHLMAYDGNPVMDATNTIEEPLAYHLGTYNDTVIVPITTSNNYLLNVVCDGEWSVVVSEELA